MGWGGDEIRLIMEALFLGWDVSEPCSCGPETPGQTETQRPWKGLHSLLPANIYHLLQPAVNYYPHNLSLVHKSGLPASENTDICFFFDTKLFLFVFFFFFFFIVWPFSPPFLS